MGTSDPEVLISWVVEVPLPPHPGHGLRRHRPPEEALRRTRRRRASVVAGQAESGGASDGSACGTLGGLAGQALAGQAEEPVGVDPWADRRASLREHVERARRFQRLIDTGEVKNAAEVARREKLTRARVCQVLRLLKLAPEVLAVVEDAKGTGPVPPEKELRKLAGLSRPEQGRRYRELVEAEAFKGRRSGRGGSPRSRVQRRGLQHQFERARRFQAMLDSGEVASLEDLGRREGLTGGRVAQLLNLLYLAPEIIEAVDVPADRLPPGVSEKKLRAISRLQDHDEQIAAFRRSMANP